MMKAWINIVVFGVVFGNMLSFTFGQQATEMFIPIGQSPGLSGKHTVIGKIESIDQGAQTVSLVGPAKTWQVKVTERTKIWLDKSQIRQSNQVGTLADLRPGLGIEVKYETREPQDASPAAWIKCAIK